MKQLFLFFSLIPTFLLASSVYPPCDNAACFNGCGIDVGVDFLYLQPCFEQNEAASIVTIGDRRSGSYEVFHYHWQPAFRVSLWLEDLLCNFSLKASYLYLAQDTHRRFANQANTELTSPIINNNLVSAQTFQNLALYHNFTYHNFDIGFVRGYLWGSCHLITPFLAVEGMILDQSYRVDGAPSITNGTANLHAKQCGNLWGAGLKLGSGYSFWILKCLRFHSQAAISMLYGNMHESIVQDNVFTPIGATTTTLHLDTKNRDCICLPALRVALGVDYQINVCNFPIAFSLGYEFLQWFNVWSYRETIPASSISSSKSSRANFGYNGLNIGLTVCF